MMIIFAFLFSLASATDYCKLCENGLHTMCQFKEGPAESCRDYTKMSLSSEEKRYIVDIHNDIRNHVASGQEYRGALGNQPAAADMSILEWDDELAEIAQRWVDQCIYVNATVQHDKCRKTERFEVGQNIITAITREKKLPELSLLVLNWYKQITHVIPSDIDEFAGIWKGSDLIGQYTQLVWAKTRYVGCAAAAFKESFGDEQYSVRFICNYGPTGNIIGQPIYQRGEPCSKCPSRLCDTLRPNLCTGTKKGAVSKKQKNVIFKFKDKATEPRQLTTISNLIGTENRKFDTSKFFNLDMLNNSEVWKTIFGLINSEDVNLERTNNNTGNMNTISTKNYTGVLENVDDSLTPLNVAVTNFPAKNEHYTSISLNEDYNLTNINHTGNLYEINYNLSNATNWIADDYLEHLKLKFVSSIKLILDDFFNKTISYKSRDEKSGAKDVLVIDLSKDECEKVVTLDNGVTVVQNCGHNSKHAVYTGRKFKSNSRRRLNDIILPDRSHFMKVKGTWSGGHCRCVQPLRSSCTKLLAPHLLVPLIYFIYFLRIC